MKTSSFPTSILSCFTREPWTRRVTKVCQADEWLGFRKGTTGAVAASNVVPDICFSIVPVDSWPDLRMYVSFSLHVFFFSPFTVGTKIIADPEKCFQGFISEKLLIFIAA